MTGTSAVIISLIYAIAELQVIC